MIFVLRKETLTSSDFSRYLVNLSRAVARRIGNTVGYGSLGREPAVRLTGLASLSHGQQSPLRNKAHERILAVDRV